jgi:hypothetical protein
VLSVVQSESPVLSVVQSESPVLSVVQSESPVLSVVQSESPVLAEEDERYLGFLFIGCLWFLGISYPISCVYRPLNETWCD